MAEKIDSNQLCDVRKGIMLYFYEDPDKTEIKRIYDSFIKITGAEFKYYFQNNGYYKRVRNKNLFYDWIESCKFNCSEVLSLTDATMDKLQNNEAYFSLSNYNENYFYNSPNTIYLECSCKISWDKIYKFILEANNTGKYYYICSNYVIGINCHLGTRSKVEGIKMLNKSKALNIWNFVWYSFDFMDNMRQGIEGPDYIQVISPEVYKKLQMDNFKSNDFRCTISNNLIIDLVEQNYSIEDNRIEDVFKKLYLLLKPIIIDIKKPKMYWKDDKWEQWRRRFED